MDDSAQRQAYPVSDKVFNVQVNKPFTELTKEEEAQLDKWIKFYVGVLSWRLQKSTTCGLLADDVASELNFRVLEIKDHLRKNPVSKGKDFHLTSYFQKALMHKFYRIRDDYWDSVAMGQQRDRAMAHAAYDDEESREMRRELHSFMDTLEEAAEKLGMEIDQTDWVESAKRIIQEGVFRYRLDGDLYEKLNKLGKALAANGEDLLPIIEEKKGGELTALIKKLLVDDPTITNDDIMEKVLNAGFSLKTRSRITRIRETMGMRLHHHYGDQEHGSIIKIAKELIKEGVSDIKEVEAELSKRNLLYKPSYVRNIFNSLRKYNADRKPREIPKPRGKIGRPKNPVSVRRLSKKLTGRSREIVRDPRNRVRRLPKKSASVRHLSKKLTGRSRKIVIDPPKIVKMPKVRDCHTRKLAISLGDHFAPPAPKPELYRGRSSKGILLTIQDLIGADPDITNKEIAQKLTDAGMQFKLNSLRAIACVERKKYGVSYAGIPGNLGKGLQGTMRKLVVEDGLENFEDIRSALVERGISFTALGAYETMMRFKKRKRIRDGAPR